MDVHEPPPAPEQNEPPRPLLPPVLLGPPAVLWLWVLPVAVLLALNLQGYLLIEGNMSADQRAKAFVLGLGGLVNLLAGAGLYAMLRRGAQRPDSALWGLPAVVAQTAYLWLALAGIEDVLPRSVTDWIYTPQRFLYNQFAFAMVPLFWGLARLACAHPRRGRGRALVSGLALAVAAPVLLFVVVHALARTGRMFSVTPYAISVLVILCGVALFVGIIRAMALWLRDADAWTPVRESIAITVFALAMPLAGLWLNSAIPFPNNFQAWEVYALTVVNALILLAAAWWRGRRPLLSLGLLCATLPFTLYFFVVFLPFLPLAPLGVIAMGAGFLVLTPTVLLVLHLSLLNKARAGAAGPRLTAGLACFLVLPGFFTARGLADKAALNAALDYVYAPAVGDGAIRYEASRANLRRALANHRAYKDGIYYPLLSDYYAWLVFDNLVLSDQKLDELEKAFFGIDRRAMQKGRSAASRGDIWGVSRGSSNRDRNRMPRANPPPRTVEVSRRDIVPRDEDGAARATLKLTLRNTGPAPAEYIRALPLPAGVHVDGFRLHIDGKPVPGRITEKKTALWVYTMIRDSERRDPGLLFYNAPGELELRVFPVAPDTPSVVEIDFIAPPGELAPESWAEPAAARWLPEIGRARLARLEEGAVFVAGPEALPVAHRSRYVHVIVDRSESNGFDGDLAVALGAIEKKFPGAPVRRVTLANYEALSLEPAAARPDALPLRGGFLADLALAQAVRSHGEADLDAPRGDEPPPRPVFVILGKKAVDLPESLALADAWADLPAGLEVHAIDAEGAPVALRDGGADVPVLRLGDSVRPLVAGRVARFKPAGAADRLEYWDAAGRRWSPVAGVEEVDGGGAWARAAALHLRQQDHLRAPGDPRETPKVLVAASRESGVMLASTSYIVVENAAQWRMLDASERRKLGQNSALGFRETPAPPAAWVAAGFALWLWGRRPRRGRGA